MFKRNLYFTSESELNQWTELINQAIGFRKIDDYYQIDESKILGKGQFGTVYEARRKVTINSRVTIKLGINRMKSPSC